MENLRELLKEAIRSIEETTAYFYQNKIDIGYKSLDNTLLKLDLVLSEVGLFRQQGNEVDIEETEIVNKLTDAMKALENKDTLLLSDLLEYEIKDILEKGYLSL